MPVLPLIIQVKYASPPTNYSSEVCQSSHWLFKWSMPVLPLISQVKYASPPTN